MNKKSSRIRQVRLLPGLFQSRVPQDLDQLAELLQLVPVCDHTETDGAWIIFVFQVHAEYFLVQLESRASDILLDIHHFKG